MTIKDTKLVIGFLLGVFLSSICTFFIQWFNAPDTSKPVQIELRQPPEIKIDIDFDKWYEELVTLRAELEKVRSEIAAAQTIKRDISEKPKKFEAEVSNFENYDEIKLEFHHGDIVKNKVSKHKGLVVNVDKNKIYVIWYDFKGFKQKDWSEKLLWEVLERYNRDSKPLQPGEKAVNRITGGKALVVDVSESDIEMCWSHGSGNIQKETFPITMWTKQ
jgi:hypothetical protein